MSKDLDDIAQSLIDQIKNDPNQLASDEETIAGLKDIFGLD